MVVCVSMLECGTNMCEDSIPSTMSGGFSYILCPSKAVVCFPHLPGLQFSVSAQEGKQMGKAGLRSPRVPGSQLLAVEASGCAAEAARPK